MPLQISSNRQYASPAAANSVNLPTTASSWTNSAWVQIAATTDVVWVLTGLGWWTNDGTASGNDDIEIDIATGGAGSEVLFTTVRLKTIIGGFVGTDQMRFMIPIDGLNGRHAARIRVNSTRSYSVFLGINILKNPISGTLFISLKPTKVYPPGAVSVANTASGTPFNNSTWSQLAAATTADIVITHLIAAMIQAGAGGEIDIGVGGAGSEVVVTTIHIDSKLALGAGGGIHELPNPLDNIPSGSRIAFRQRCSVASVSTHAALMYQEKPL